MTQTENQPTAALVFDMPTEYVDRTLQTASWYDKYLIQPGTYPFEWTTIEGRPQMVGRPYYAKVTLDAVLTEEYRVNRLLSHSSSHTKLQSTLTKITRSVYAYQVPGCPGDKVKHPLETFLGGRVVML